MTVDTTRTHLDSGKSAIVALAHAVTPDEATWKPSPERWSVLEVMCHLCDIEAEDFPTDLEIILFHPQDPWPNFNIHDWITEHDYASQEIEATVERFVTLRDASLRWLAEIGEIDLEKQHSGNGFKNEALKAGDVLAAWVAHDMFHIRQLALLIRDSVEEGPYKTVYSGFEL